MKLKHLMTLKYEIRECSEIIDFLSVMGDGARFLSLRLVHQFCMGREHTVMAAHVFLDKLQYSPKFQMP